MNSDWEFDKDPFDIVPIGFVVPGQYSVVGFAAPAGVHIKKLVVKVRYPDSYYRNTTCSYLHVLHDFMKQASVEDINAIVSRRSP